MPLHCKITGSEAGILGCYGRDLRAIGNSICIHGKDNIVLAKLLICNVEDEILYEVGTGGCHRSRLLMDFLYENI